MSSFGQMHTSETATDSTHDLVGGPFAVIESDPGVFTTLIRKLGVRGLEVTELYSVEPFATDHLNPYGLVFCYLCDEDIKARDEFGADADELDDPDARDVWFANQLSDDACASQAILNVLLNCRGVDLGPALREFAADTERMSPVMRGLAISNSSHIREAQNALARPADLRGAYHALATTALESAKSKAKASSSSTPSKRRKPPVPSSRKTTQVDAAYHYIGYVPARGRVWELDGLRAAGPLDIGPLGGDGDGHGAAPAVNGSARAGWMDVVRPALQRRMRGMGPGMVENEGAGHIQYNLLAIVDDAYPRVSDAMEMLKRQRAALERRLDDAFPAGGAGAGGWAEKVDPALLASAAAAASGAFSTSLRPDARTLGGTFAPDFGARKLDKDMAVLDLPVRALVPAWEACVRAALEAKIAVEEEVARSRAAQADNVKRTFDYAPLIREFVAALQREGRWDEVLTEGGGAEARAPTAETGTPKAKRPRKKKA